VRFYISKGDNYFLNAFLSRIDKSVTELVRINAKLLLVVEQEESFTSARNTCMNMGAELLAYSNPMRFFQPSIDKILKNNSYWLGG
jgi:hypothetical protein